MPAAQAGIDRGPETYPLLGRLQSCDRIVITGASGWLGRSLLHELEAALGEAMLTQVLALGSRARAIRLSSGRLIEVLPWQHEIVAEWQPTACVHLAYLTRDHVGDGSLDEFVEGNLHLTSMAARLQQLPGLRAFVTSSSGAAVTLDWAEAVSKRQIYGYLKRLDESFFSNEGVRLGVPTVIARTWSVSGPYCTKPALFAFTDVINQARITGTITIESKGAVWRRYVDAGQYLALCLAVALGGQDGIIDSTGDLVEIRALASQVANQLGATFQGSQANPSIAPDRYFSSESALDNHASRMAVRLLALPEQVLMTNAGLLTELGAS